MPTHTAPSSSLAPPAIAPASSENQTRSFRPSVLPISMTQLPAQQKSDRPHLELQLGCSGGVTPTENRHQPGTQKTVFQHRYMKYPLSISPIFRAEDDGSLRSLNRAYLYRMNNAAGLLAGDKLKTSLQLAPDSALYLSDHAATKVHSMPLRQSQNYAPSVDIRATVEHHIEVGDRAMLEYLPEPLILFADSALTQTIEVTLHPEATLSLGEIIVPGRLARGECYQFRQYLKRLQLKSPDGRVWLTKSEDLKGNGSPTMHLEPNPMAEPMVHSGPSAGMPVLGTLIVALPKTISIVESHQLLQCLIQESDLNGKLVPLPENRGWIIRAMSPTTRTVQTCFKQALNVVRQLHNQTPLPYSVMS